VCLIVQRWARGCLARKFRAKLLRCRPVLLKALQTRNSLAETTSAIEFVESTVGTYSRVFPYKTREWLDCQELKRQLQERHRVTEECRACLPHDPEANFTNLERAVQAGMAIDAYPGTADQLKVFQDAKAMYDLTNNRRTCRAELRRATEEAERDTLEHNLALAVELGIGNAPEIAAAKQMVERCKQEEVICDELDRAQAQGGVRRHTDGNGALDPQAPRAAADKARGFGMRTARGVYLEQLCGFVHRLRLALQSVPWDGSEDWPAVAALVGELGLPAAPRPVAAALPPAEEGAEGEEGAEAPAEAPAVTEPVSYDEYDLRGAEEVAWAADELVYRRRQREVHSVLQQGIDELNEETLLSFAGHVRAHPFVGGPDQKARNQAVEAELIAEAERQAGRIGDVRAALEAAAASAEENALCQSIELARGLPVDHSHAVALLESLFKAQVQLAMKFHIDYGKRVEVGLILDDELAESTSASVVAQSSGATIQVVKSELVQELQTQTNALQQAVEFGQGITLASDQGRRLLDQGAALLGLRQCLVNRDWPNLEARLSTALSAQVDGPETNLAKDETTGRCTAEDCLEALRQAVADVVNPSDDYGHPSEGILETRLGQAERLEMKDLPDIVAARSMHEQIKSTRQELQRGLDVTPYADAVGLAEEYNQLYTLFDGSTKQLNAAIAQAQGFTYVTKETQEAEALLSEITILWYLQEDLQTGGYYDGAQPGQNPAEVVQLDNITSHYNDYSGFNYVTDIGQYIVRKVYYILLLRNALYDFCAVPDGVNDAVPQADDIGCPETPELVSAQAFLQQLDATRAAMQEAEQVVREDLLITAMQMADALFFNNDDVERVRALRDRVIELNEESRKALWIMDKDRMKAVYDNANAIRLTTAHLEYIGGLLELGAMEWLKYEIKKARELEDNMRKIRLAIAMKDLTLDQFGHMFTLESLKNMRSPENYASQKLISLDRKKLAAGMLSYSKHAAHTSLVDFSHHVNENDPQSNKLVNQLIKDSTRTFKNIMGYMGDKKANYPTTLVQEILQICLDQPLMRSEVYLQTIKQITNHPIPGNQRKGYELLAVWCWQFPPQDDLDNILEIYLRSVPEKSIGYLGRLRDVQYSGTSPTAPGVDEIDRFVRDFFGNASTHSKYQEVLPIADAPYPDGFFLFETPKSLFLIDEEEAKYKI